jgi:hypothetical protein
VSALLALANPRRIKASHRRRWLGTTAHSEYANNSPFRYYDPSGRYTCEWSDEDCGSFENGADLVRETANSSRLTEEESRNLKEVSDSIGANGDNNGVVIKFGDTPLAGGSEAYDQSTRTTTLTLRGNSDLRNLGKNIAHEARHGLVDSQRGRMDNNREERTENEIQAYTTQAYYQKALQYSTNRSDPWIYGAGVSQENISKKANESVENACFGTTTGSCGE